MGPWTRGAANNRTGCRSQAEAQTETFIPGERVVYSRGLMYSLVSRNIYPWRKSGLPSWTYVLSDSYSRGHMYPPQTSDLHCHSTKKKDRGVDPYWWSAKSFSTKSFPQAAIKLTNQNFGDRYWKSTSRPFFFFFLPAGFLVSRNRSTNPGGREVQASSSIFVHESTGSSSLRQRGGGTSTTDRTSKA